MEKREFHIGPGAASLLLVVVVLSMSVLALLAMLNVRSDTQLTERSVALVQAQYDAGTEAEYRFAELDALVARLRVDAADDAALLAAVQAALDEACVLQDDVIYWKIPATTSDTLCCAARVLPLESAARLEWVNHSFSTSLGEDFVME